MTDKELRKLRREDLLQILIAQQRQIDELKASLEQTQTRLDKRNIAIEQSGSIAEAALRLNDVFGAAQASVDQYVNEMHARADALNAEAEARAEEARRNADELLKSARSEADRILRECRGEGERVKAIHLKEAQEEADRIKEEAEKLLQEARMRTGAEPPTLEQLRATAEEDGKQRRGLLWRNRKA